MKPIELEELAKASGELVEFFKKHCNIHQCIVIDSTGVKIVSDDCFVPFKDCLKNDKTI